MCNSSMSRPLSSTSPCLLYGRRAERKLVDRHQDVASRSIPGVAAVVLTETWKRMSSSLRREFEAIADAGEGTDNGLVLTGLDFSAQAADPGAQVLRFIAELCSPDTRQQLAMQHHPPRIARQLL